MKYFSIFILSLLIVKSTFCAEANWEWVQTSKGKNTNSIIWELQKVNFLKSELPAFKEDFGFKRKNKKSSLDEALMEVLGGPPDESVSRDESSIVLTACRPHSCDEKGFYWVNSKDKTSIMAIIHFVYQGKLDKSPQLFLASKNYKCGQYPDAANIQMNFWLKSKKVTPLKIRCLYDGHVGEGKI
jgi:hypothetical protein